MVPVPTGKTTELLARLAMAPGSRVRTDLLLDELWADSAGRNTLQSKVSQLRRALGDRDLLVGSPDGYTLAIDRGCVDAFRAVDLAAETTAASRAEDAATVLDKAMAGLALFRGDVLADAGDWATPHRARLSELRLGLLEEAMAARLDLGAGGEIVGELEALVAEHPLREGFWACLITALYRSGRQADALAAYTRVRALLMEELGIEPGSGLRDLEQQVLLQSPSLGSQSNVRQVTIPGNVPAVGRALIGRDAALVSLMEASGQHRLVTIAGPAGVGKTRLAMELAQGFSAPGGVWMIRLDSADSGSDLAQVAAEAMHVQGGRTALLERLAGAETVLILDNCEHLIEGVAAAAAAWLDAAPRLSILATSQVPLGIEGEQVYVLEPLSSQDSVALFEHRAREMRRQFVLDAETTALVEEVCLALDGLPLAIELAAARVRSLSVHDIVRRLDDRFALLRDPTSNRPERRRALVGAIAWSYELLFPDDQRGLWALSCFAGTATLDATEYVLGALGVPSSSVLDTIGRLVDRSLVSLEIAADGSVRYRLLDSIGAYAADRLSEAGAEDVAKRAHATWFADTAAWCDANVRGERQPECVAIATAERANVDAARAWCLANEPDLGVRISNGFGWTWVVLGDGPAGAARIRQSLVDSTPARDRATACLLAGWLETSAGNVTLAQEDLDIAHALAEELDDDVLRADVFRHRAFLGIQQGQPAVVLAAAGAGLATYRRLGMDWQIAGSLLLSAYGSIMLGDIPTAARDAGEALGIVGALGDSWGLVHAEAMLGGIAQALHQFDDAVRALSRAVEESEKLGFSGQAALHLATLARVQQRAGDRDAAAATFNSAIANALAVGDGRLASTARLNLARLHRAEGDALGALVLLEENQRWYDAAGGGDGALLSRCLLAAERRDVALLEAVLSEARAVQNVEVQVQTLDALSSIAGGSGDLDGAAELLAEADALAPMVAHLLDAVDRLDATVARELL